MAETPTLCVAFLADKQDNQPRVVEVPWDKLAERLTRHTERADKDGPLWTPASYVKGARRSNASVLGVALAVGDFDNGTSWEEVKERLADYEYVAHSTHSYEPEHPKFRVAIPFSRAISRAEWADIRGRIDHHVFKLANDPATKDPSRAYYLPSCPPGCMRFAERHSGKWLDARALPEVPRAERNNGQVGTNGPRIALGKAALHFVANGAPIGEQRMRAVAAARNYLSAGYPVEETAAALWRGFQASAQENGKEPWTEDDAYQIASDLASKPGPFIDVRPRVQIEEGRLPSEFRDAGLGYICDFPTAQIRMTVDHLRRSSEGMAGEVLVETSIPTLPPHLHWARLNMSSTSARNTLAKFLRERTSGLELDWAGMLEILCRRVAVSEREGEPFVAVGERETEDQVGWLVQNFAPRGEAMTIYGDGGVGKSLLALAIGLSVRTGIEIVPGYAPTELGNVLYLDWEANWERMNSRVKAICRGIGTPPVSIEYRRCVGPLVDQIEEVLRHCQDKGVILVVVDSVEMAMSGSGMEGDPNDKVVRLHSALRLLKCTSVLVDHINAASRGVTSGAGKPIGGVFKTNLARMAYEVRKAQDNITGSGLHIALFNVKRNDDGPVFGPVGLLVEFGGGIARYCSDSIADPALVTGLPVADQIAHALHDGPRTRKELLAQIRGTTGAVDMALKRGTEIGRFAQVAHGRYELPQATTEPEVREQEEIPF